MPKLTLIIALFLVWAVCSAIFICILTMRVRAGSASGDIRRRKHQIQQCGVLVAAYIGGAAGVAVTWLLSTLGA